jgi:flavin-binding protein dodecin
LTIGIGRLETRGMIEKGAVEDWLVSIRVGFTIED